MGHTALILGDQLMADNPALDGAQRVLFVESQATLARVNLHRRRAHVVLSAMRHRADVLRETSEVEVVERRGARSFAQALRDERDVVCAAPNRAGAREHLEGLGVRLVPSNQFLTDPDAFAAWAKGRRRLVMEDFYREQRRRHGVLVDEHGEPEGGRWNLDSENRRPPREGLSAPDPWTPAEDAIDAEVRTDLDRWRGLRLWGEDGPRAFAVTPGEARSALRSFVAARLAGFGPWQDAMVAGERTLFHSRLSVPLNLGVLEPLRAVRAAERAYRRGDAPLQSVEGFVRQIIGWREYVWGMYWLRRDRWPRANALRARRDLPQAYLGRETGWNCLDTVVRGVHEDGYAHHIERLMVLGTTLLMAGVKPWEAVRWFERGFVDGAEWVMAPNAAGMALFADGGEMMTKPYAAGGNYINRMSNFCPGCRYRPNVRTGLEACPVTALYWDFIARHGEGLRDNRRMQMPLKTLQRMDPDERAAIAVRARDARRELEEGAAQGERLR
jgi:deoxyribodipyrimidine photolyase-related protein